MVIPNYDVLVKSNIVNLSLISDGLVSTQTVLLSILCKLPSVFFDTVFDVFYKGTKVNFE